MYCESLLPWSPQKSQLNYRTISLESSWTEVLKLRLWRSSHIEVNKSAIVENQEGYPLRSDGVQAPCQVSPDWSTSARKRSPKNIWLWKSSSIPFVCVRQKAAKNPGNLLKDHARTLASRNSPWAPADRGSEAARHTGRNWVPASKERSWRDGHQGLSVEPSANAGSYHLYCVDCPPTPHFTHMAKYESALVWSTLLAPH